MGRNKKYFKTLHQQAYDRLVSMQAFGESKTADRAKGIDRDKIYSYSTYKTYWQQIKYFCRWMGANHPKVTSLKKARRYVPEYLQEKTDAYVAGETSAWTVQTGAKALGKLFGIAPDDPDYFKPPKRQRVEITRSRGPAARDQQFSERNNQELVDFCRATGLRRSELEMLQGSDLISYDAITDKITELETQEDLSANEVKELAALKDAARFTNTPFFVYVRKGKGGRIRYSPIIGDNADHVVERMSNTPTDAKVWTYIPDKADIHSYRSDYASMIYKWYARPLDRIPYDRVNKGSGRKYQSQVYVCRKDESNKKLDKAAMLMASKALGHNRLEIVANNYIRGI